MKRVCFLLACLYLLAMLSACSQPVNNSSDGPSTTTQDSASSSSTVPNGSKKDELTVVFYHPHGAEEDISLSAEDCDILLQVAREANFAPMGPEGELNSIRDIRFTIRHYKAADNAFFADENVQYTDEDGNPTNDYVAAKIAQLVVMDVLFQEYCHRNRARCEDNIQRIAAALSDKHL